MQNPSIRVLSLLRNNDHAWTLAAAFAYGRTADAAFTVADDKPYFERECDAHFNMFFSV